MIHGAATVNPADTGTKCAFWYQVTVPAGQTAELRLRLRPAGNGPGQPRPARRTALGADFDQVMAERRAEADEFYAELTPAGASADEALVLRQASAGMLWSKQLFYYDVARWLDGDPTQPDAARGAQERAELQVAQLRRVRHHLDAGQVGVSLVRRLGPGLPHASPWPTWTRRSPSTS